MNFPDTFERAHDMVATLNPRARYGETQPLLAADTDDLIDASNANSIARRNAKKSLVMIACALFLVAAEFGFYISQAPQTAIFEQIICRNHFRAGELSDGTPSAPGAGDPCKSELVQGELALVLGDKEAFEVLPSMFSARGHE